MSDVSTHELCDARVKLSLDAAALQIPDRVPVFGPYQKYPSAFAGVAVKEAMNDNGRAIDRPFSP